MLGEIPVGGSPAKTMVNECRGFDVAVASRHRAGLLPQEGRFLDRESLRVQYITITISDRVMELHL